jgi:hypothetical protein
MFDLFEFAYFVPDLFEMFIFSCWLVDHEFVNIFTAQCLFRKELPFGKII